MKIANFAIKKLLCIHTYLGNIAAHKFDDLTRKNSIFSASVAKLSVSSMSTSKNTTILKKKRFDRFISSYE